MGNMRVILLSVLGLLAALILAAGIWAYAPDKPRASLEAKYAPPPSQFLDLMGLRLHVRDTGARDGPALLFVHGFGSSLHTWEELARGLDATHRVIRLDLPGFGLTGPDPTGDYSDARSFAVLLALMDRLGIARASVIGSSMGGRIAWGLAAAHPERVERLVLMAPDGFASPGRGYQGEGAAPPKMPWWAGLLPWVLPDRLLRPMLVRTYGDPTVLTEDLFARYRDMLRAPGVRQAILDRMKDSGISRPEDRLRSIQMPVLLLWGELDRAIPASHAADYQRELRDSRLVVLPGVGHVPMEEAPAGTLTALRAFLPQP